MRNVDPIEVMFDPPYRMDFTTKISDMIDAAIGVLKDQPDELLGEDEPPLVKPDPIQSGYVFIAMPMDAAHREYDDVHDAIKQAAANCGLNAERTDDVQDNERITDRILESIRKAQFIVAEFARRRVLRITPTGQRSVAMASEAPWGPTGVAAGRRGLLVLEATHYRRDTLTRMRELREKLEKRLRALATKAP